MALPTDLGELLNAIDARALSAGVESLSPAERSLHLISALYFEVPLGGFSGYYYNSAGNHAVQAVEALEAVGATQSAEALRSANRVFPGGAPAADRDTRFEQLQLLHAMEPDPLHAVTTAFNGVSEDIDALLEAYATAHGILAPGRAL